MDEDEGLSPVISLDLRAIRACVEEADGDLVLLVDDGDVQVEFNSGLCGRWEQAIYGAERIATTALAYAQELRRRGIGPQRTDEAGLGRTGDLAGAGA